MNGASAAHPSPDARFWRGKRVFLTGHTGFKGGWLALWLKHLGAVVHGLSLEPPTEPNLFTLARVGEGLAHQIGDIRDENTVRAAVAKFEPDIILHLAAQPILRLSYDEPVATYATNLMGTVHVLEAARRSETARVTLAITTDKCYENREREEPYRETDPLGGHDPYSSSKGCAELAISAYGRSFFHDGDAAVASARAGNVIGGGDWAQDRLMTDILAAVAKGKKPVIRNPGAIRPWQHVLEPLSGYLSAVEYLWRQKPRHPESWNFGPDPDSEVPVADVAGEVCRLWGFADGLEIQPDARRLHEAHFLRLDSKKAKAELGWKPRLSLPDALRLTVEWHRAHLDGRDMQAQTLAQIEAYQKL
jgi:CDP-glucose 4,6-dehydratase